MKRMLSIFAAIGLISACGGVEPDAADPYAGLAEDTLLIRFEANPDIQDGMCNPKVLYAIRSDLEAIRINATYIINEEDIMGSGFSVIPRETPGILSATEDLSMFDPLTGACSDVSVRVQEMMCDMDGSFNNVPCPPAQYEGTEIFASFSE